MIKKKAASFSRQHEDPKDYLLIILMRRYQKNQQRSFKDL